MAPKHLGISGRQLGKIAWSSQSNSNTYGARQCHHDFSVTLTNQHMHASLNTFSLSLRLEVQNQVCLRVTSSQNSEKNGSLCFHLLLASCDPRYHWSHDQPTPACLCPFLCVSLLLVSSRTHTYNPEGPHLGVPSINTSANTLLPNKFMAIGTGGWNIDRAFGELPFQDIIACIYHMSELTQRDQGQENSLKLCLKGLQYLFSLLCRKTLHGNHVH